MSLTPSINPDLIDEIGAAATSVIFVQHFLDGMPKNYRMFLYQKEGVFYWQVHVERHFGTSYYVGGMFPISLSWKSIARKVADSFTELEGKV